MNVEHTAHSNHNFLLTIQRRARSNKTSDEQDTWQNGLRKESSCSYLQQVGGLLDTAGVIDNNNLQRRVFSAVPAPEEVAPCLEKYRLSCPYKRGRSPYQRGRNQRLLLQKFTSVCSMQVARMQRQDLQCLTNPSEAVDSNPELGLSRGGTLPCPSCSSLLLHKYEDEKVPQAEPLAIF